MIDMTTPQGRVAQHFMDRKGLGHFKPVDVEQLDDQPCWYFLYEMPDGTLELEVFYDAERMEWECVVSTFTPPEKPVAH